MTIRINSLKFYFHGRNGRILAWRNFRGLSHTADFSDFAGIYFSRCGNVPNFAGIYFRGYRDE